MKTIKPLGIKLFILAAVAVLFWAAQFKNPGANERGFLSTTVNPVPDTQFVIGAFENAKDLNYYFKDSFSFNTWHKYTGPTNYGWPGVTDDKYDADTSVYGPGVISRISSNTSEGMRTLMDRPIIEYLVGGQRIDYECEFIDSNFTASRYWYYAYRYSIDSGNTIYDTIDNSKYGAGERVKKCRRTDETALNGFVAIDSGLRANRELAFIQTNQWMRDNAYKWYIMPRIRIDSAYAANGNNDSISVCKIVLRGKNGNIVKEITLRVENFKNSINNQYDGSYKEMYKYSFGQTKPEIDTSEINNYFVDTKNTFYWEGPINYTDIQIYWSGKCDMWIDRVRLENLPAHQYLTLKDIYHQELVSKVNSEVGWASRNSGKPIPNYFYFEECQMSHFPVIKELNRQIDSVSGGKNELVVFLNYDLFTTHIPHNWKYSLDPNLMKQYLYDDYGLRTIIMGSYPLEGWNTDEMPNDPHRISYHPNTLHSEGYNTNIGILSYSQTPVEYDTWLQTHFDDNGYPYGVNYSAMMKLIYDLSKNGMRIINGAQAHLVFSAGHKLKEPSNEELGLMANLTLTNNAKGLIWFVYVGDNKTFDSATYNKGNCNLM